MEPFNMREEEQMGEIDEDGFFVFNRKRGYRDAWLDSIAEQNEEKVVDQLRKQIKEENRFKSVEQEENRASEAYLPD